MLSEIIKEKSQIDSILAPKVNGSCLKIPLSTIKKIKSMHKNVCL